jgi:hypothetical protein
MAEQFVACADAAHVPLGGAPPHRLDGERRHGHAPAQRSGNHAARGDWPDPQNLLLGHLALTSIKTIAVFVVILVYYLDGPGLSSRGAPPHTPARSRRARRRSAAMKTESSDGAAKRSDLGLRPTPPARSLAGFPISIPTMRLPRGPAEIHRQRGAREYLSGRPQRIGGDMLKPGVVHENVGLPKRLSVSSISRGQST